MRSRKPLGLALIVAAAAMVTMAVAAPGASATVVEPADTQIAAELKEGTQSDFYLDNGYSPIYVSCTESLAEFKTPLGGEPNQWANTNIPNPGNQVSPEQPDTQSQTQGSVSSQLKDVVFDDCGTWFSEKQDQKGVELAPADVIVADPTKWTIAAEWIAGDVSQVAIGVPQNDTVIGTLGCDFLVGEEQQTVVMGTFDDSQESQELRLDGQVKFDVYDEGLKPPTGLCLALDEMAHQIPAQYEAEFDVDDELTITEAQD